MHKLLLLLNSKCEIENSKPSPELHSNKLLLLSATALLCSPPPLLLCSPPPLLLCSPSPLLLCSPSPLLLCFSTVAAASLPSPLFLCRCRPCFSAVAAPASLLNRYRLLVIAVFQSTKDNIAKIIFAQTQKKGIAMMTSSSSSTISASPSAIATKASTNYLYRYSSSMLSFRLSTKPNLRLFTKGSPPSRMLCPRIKAQPDEVRFFQWSELDTLFSSILSYFVDMLLGSSFALKNKAAVDGSSNATATNKTKSEVATVSVKETKPSSEPSSGVLATEESISQFVTQVASLVKLVDSRDIVELKLKQLDCEVAIRKNENVPQPQPLAQVTMIYSSPSPVVSPVTQASIPTPTPPPSTPTPLTSPAAFKSAKSSNLPLKSPMAGTFYRSPALGEPPLVKVGDKVKKGQVLCIIEAMKLMNEIEANQSGTIADILVEDGKPVSVDTPLFVFEP